MARLPTDPKVRKEKLRKAIYKKKWKRLKVLKVGKCAKCGSPDNLTVDHIRPLSKGGTNAKHNLQALCKPCNEEKADQWKGKKP